MLQEALCFIVFLALSHVHVRANEESLPFWDFTNVKKWSSSLLPKEMNADWNLGLGSFTCAIQKQRGAKLNLTQTAIISLNYFSIVQLFDTSQMTINDGAMLDLKDQSQFAGRESSNVVMEPGSIIDLQSTKMVPGAITMGTGSKILLADTRFTSLLAMINMQQGSALKTESRTQITLLGGSKLDIGKNSSLSLLRTIMSIAGDMHVGPSCLIDLQGTDFTIVGGVVNLGKKVEFRTESRSVFTVFSSQVNFTEGAKINLASQAEFAMERNSSLIMARRDLRLKIDEKGLLKLESGANCLMTDDLTVQKQSSKIFTSTTNADSFRCFNTMQKLIDEKRQHFPDN